MSIPHNNNFNTYDFVFEKRYGNALLQLTNSDISAIQTLLPHKSSVIIDIGSGTGRLAIPLALKGHKVFAVDQSEGMNDVLTQKAHKQNLNIPTSLSLMNGENIKADLVLSIFTVLAYITDEVALKNMFGDIFKSLNAGGLFLFDLADKEPYLNKFDCNNGVIFQNRQNEFMDLVTVSFHLNLEHCTYRETVIGTNNGRPFSYTEEFVIRFWKFDTVNLLLIQSGFVQSEIPISINIPGTKYYLFQKPLK